MAHLVCLLGQLFMKLNVRFHLNIFPLRIPFARRL